MIAVDPRLMNQFSTTAEAVLQVKNASPATAVESRRAGIGTPCFVVFASIAGALPFLASPKIVREAWNNRQLVQLHAEVMLHSRISLHPSQEEMRASYITALQRSGRKGISSLFIAMMKGDLATPLPVAKALTTSRLVKAWLGREASRTYAW